KDFFLAHLVRNDEDETVGLLRRDESQAEAGIAGSGFDERAAGLEPAIALGRGDQRQADAVLDRARRVLVLQLDEELTAARVYPRHLQQRRVADRVEHVAMDDHGFLQRRLTSYARHPASASP